MQSAKSASEYAIMYVTDIGKPAKTATASTTASSELVNLRMIAASRHVAMAPMMAFISKPAAAQSNPVMAWVARRNHGVPGRKATVRNSGGFPSIASPPR